jgi:hypothetical protein
MGCHPVAVVTLDLYMFPELLPHPQEALQKWHLVYCVRAISVGCTKIKMAPENEQVML